MTPGFQPSVHSGAQFLWRCHRLGWGRAFGPRSNRVVGPVRTEHHRCGIIPALGTAQGFFPIMNHPRAVSPAHPCAVSPSDVTGPLALKQNRHPTRHPVLIISHAAQGPVRFRDERGWWFERFRHHDPEPNHWLTPIANQRVWLRVWPIRAASGDRNVV